MKRLVLWAALAALAGCGSAAPKKDVVQNETLYEQLGRKSGIERLVDASLKQVHADPRIKQLFADTDMRDSRRLLVEQICEATGGPCKYTGRSMEEAHSGMNLDEGDFTAFVSDIITAMNEVKLPVEAQQQVLQWLWSQKSQVVGQ